MKNPDISVCIPVFETEEYLEQCLRSVVTQDFPSFEIVVVSDASLGRDSQGRSAKKIVRAMEKESRRLRKAMGQPAVELRFIEHSENRGLIEVRRTSVYESRGKYILQCDSDDQLAPGALSALWSAATTTAHTQAPAGQTLEQDTSSPGGTQPLYDIIHGSSTAGTFDSQNNFTPSKQNRYNAIHHGKLEGRSIFESWLLGREISSNTWGKLIKREIFLQAFDSIPYTECNMAEDFLLFFFISQNAKNYIGIENQCYRYRDNAGMTSTRKIDSLQKWKMVCSAASVFTIISQWLQENPERLTPPEVESIKGRTVFYLKNNLKQMKETVIPELLPQARQLLCDYWGQSFVEKIESEKQ